MEKEEENQPLALDTPLKDGDIYTLLPRPYSLLKDKVLPKLKRDDAPMPDAKKLRK